MTSEIAESRTAAEQTAEQIVEQAVVEQAVDSTAFFPFDSWDDIERRRPTGHIAGRRRMSTRAVRAARRARAARTGDSVAAVGPL